MALTFIDVPELMNAHPFIKVAMRIVEDNYREYQGDIINGGEWCSAARESRCGFRGALEVLKTQIAVLLEVDPDRVDLDSSLRGHIHDRCGRPEAPKGYVEWNLDNRYSSLV